MRRYHAQQYSRITEKILSIIQESFLWKGWVHTQTGESSDFDFYRDHLDFPPEESSTRSTLYFLKRNWARVLYDGTYANIETYGTSQGMMEILRDYFLSKGLSDNTRVLWTDSRRNREETYILGNMGRPPKRPIQYFR